MDAMTKPNRAPRWRRGCVAAILLPLLLGMGAVALSAFSNLTLPPAPTVLDRLTPLDSARLQETLHLKQTLGEAVWPGWGQTDIPVIVWNRQFAFAVGLTEAPAGWEVVPGETFATEPYYRQAAHAPQNFAVRLGDRWAASMATKWETDDFLISKFREMMPGPLRPVFPYRLLILPTEVQLCSVLHETFHAYQAQTSRARFDDAEKAYKSGDLYWAADEAMRAAWKTEIDLLVRAVGAGSEAEARTLARQFLAARDQRRQAARLDAGLVDYERRFEWLEGLAKYVELESWRQAATTAGYTPLPALNADPEFKGYATFSQRWGQELDQLRRQAEQPGETRFYYTGLGQAALLDRLRPGWKAQALAEGAWLEGLLRAAVQPPD